MGKATRALEKEEIHKLFTSIEGKFAMRNKTMLICGISMALRATELVSLNVADILDRNRQIKTYVTITRCSSFYLCRLLHTYFWPQ